VDTDAVRRSWPDVLTKIATISRATWSFVSQNTQVLDYNGERLLLGLSTDGLLSVLRGRNHAEVVRQALIEVLGVDTRVEGVLSAEAASVDLPATASDTSVPVAQPGGPALKTTAPEAKAGVPVPAPAPAPALRRDPEPDDGWNTSAPPSAPADAPPLSTPDQPVVPGRPSTPRQRAKAAVAQETSRRNTGSSSVADDSVVSPDDEDIEEAGAAGQPVIERVLGGVVIGELDQ